MNQRSLLATYLCGFLSLSFLQMVALVTPLWGDHLGLSVAMIGLASGARSVTPLIYSIHFGSLMDSVGVRRFLIFFAAQCALVPVLYPLLPFAEAFLLLQLVLGLAAATVWLAAQTAIARISAGDARKTGWFSFFTSAGTVAGPLALGLAWSGGGPAGGYGLLAGWGAALFAASLFLPRRKDIVRPPLSLRIFIPKLSSYALGLGALRRPVALFVIACTFLRLSSVSMLESFSPLLLQGLGFSAAAIGALFAIGNLASSPSALVAPWWVRICGSSRRALTISVAVSIGALTVMPLFEDFWQLAAAIAIFGFGLGVSMPLIFTLLSRGIAADQQGVTAGLRATANRLAAFVLPVVMGLVAELVGVAGAFWVMGIILLLVLLLVEAAFMKRV